MSPAPPGPGTAARPRPGPGTVTGATGVPHLREVLAAAAVSSGLHLHGTVPGALTHDQACRAARSWGLGQDPGGTVLVMADGLGLELLLQRRGHAPTLRSWLAEAESAPTLEATTCAPTTTAAALTTLGTSALPGTTGMVGYSVVNPARQPLPPDATPCREHLLCLISWEGQDAPAPRAWQDVPTVFERLRPAARAAAPLAVAVTPARFAGSGLTVAALRGARHVGADRLEDRPAHAVRALRRGVPLVYLYVGELDHAGHAHGWRSQQWLTQLERLDRALDHLLRAVPAGTRVVLTADHGMVDTDADHRVTVTDHPDLVRDVTAVAGEPRLTSLCVRGSDPDLAHEVARRWRDHLGQAALWVGTREQSAALLGPLSPRARGVVGDVLVAMAGSWVVVDPRVHAPAAMALPGVHGSLTRAETSVPLLVRRA